MGINSPNYLNNDVTAKRREATDVFFFSAKVGTWHSTGSWQRIDARELIKRNDCDKRIRRTECVTTNGIENVPFTEQFRAVNAMQFAVENTENILIFHPEAKLINASTKIHLFSKCHTIKTPYTNKIIIYYDIFCGRICTAQIPQQKKNHTNTNKHNYFV